MGQPSELQRETSRRNGAKGRGPVTPGGKARSGRNAVKHGITAQVSLNEQDLPGAVLAITPAIHAISERPGGEPGLATSYLTAAVRLERARDRSHQLLYALHEADELGAIVDLIDELDRMQDYERRFCGQRDRLMRKLIQQR